METTFSVNIFRHFYEVLISTKKRQYQILQNHLKKKNIYTIYNNLNWGDTGQLITFNPNYLIRISTVETFNFSP